MSTSPNIAVQEKEVHHGFPSFSKYTVSAVDPQAALSASVSISSTSYGQTLVIPVTLIHVADHSAAIQGRYPFSENNKSLCLKPTRSCCLKWTSRASPNKFEHVISSNYFQYNPSRLSLKLFVELRLFCSCLVPPLPRWVTTSHPSAP